MNLIKRSNSLVPSIPSFFDDFLTKDISDWFNTNFSTGNASIPAVNIIENEQDFTVEMAAPGMSKKDFKIDLENHVLTISSEKKEGQEEKNEKGGYFRREFSYRSFQRCFRLPDEIIDTKHIHATYEDGILKLVLPKLQIKKSGSVQHIEIK